eukprot:c18225_g1_i1.p1 GENE.c18225_g1_i1~~c18225_g1_i1.p1  ORF type:complete len:532 (+),score=200.83 c18225_g1_i1:19-1614(+)
MFLVWVCVLLFVSLQLLCIEGRIAPHFLSVGSGVGLPSAVKDKYHSTSVILQSMVELERTCKFLVRHEIEAIDPNTNSPRKNDAYTLTDPDVSKDNKKRFMLTFGVHGREYISSETALHLSRFVCEKTSATTGHVANIQTSKDSKDALIPPALVPDVTTKSETAPKSDAKPESIVTNMIETELDKSAFGSKMTVERLKEILKKTEITFIPIVNIDGRKKVETGDSCTNQRKNGRNVDINRNFQNWWNPSNAHPYEEDYQGPSAMSEWETNVIKTLAEKFQPHAFIDIHSGDLGLGYVYGHSSTEVSRHDLANSKWTKLVDEEVFGGKVWNGNLARMGSMPYESHGSSCDYMYESQNAKISGTWEVWRKPSFFGSSNSASDASSSAAAAKYEHVSVSLTPIKKIDEKIATSVDQKVKPDSSLSQSNLIQSPPVDSFDKELQSLIDSSVGQNGVQEMGLTKEDMQVLVQSMKTEGKQNQEIQTLLQEMSREQCFAYFNPIMPDHYDRTVKGFSYAILVGAEKLSSPEVIAACS